jgi:thioredoxin reductase (NADPH)
MDRPIIFAVDDEPAVLGALVRDLRREYGAQYRVLRADAGATALDMLRQLKLGSDQVALFLCDQRMPRMTGVEFLAEAITLFPDAKRVLLTAYADTEAAIRAINDIQLNHYLLKPWDPPEERLYPILNDLLDDWQADFQPPFNGIRIVGHRWSAQAYDVKNFLIRNLIPYRWVDVESDDEGPQLLELAGAGPAQLPLVLFPDGVHLIQPTPLQLAAKLGLKTQSDSPFYDLVIVGGGPAGLAAAVYGASEGLRTLLVDREAPGGQAGTSSRIENYLGFPVGLSGGDLTRRAVAQAARFGVEILTPVEATALRTHDAYRFVSLSNGSEVSCHALIIATGVSYRTLDAPGLDRLTGAGVYYGASLSEALAAQGKDVFIAGGGNSAGQAAMYLAKYARSVTIMVRGASLSASMSSYLIAQIEATPKIQLRTHCAVAAVDGNTSLECISLTNTKTQVVEAVPADFLFIFIGAMPRTSWVADRVACDKFGFILTGSDVMHDGQRPRGWTLPRDPYWLEASIPGVFVAGDVHHSSVKRIASAVGEGAMAVSMIHQYLAEL